MKNAVIFFLLGAIAGAVGFHLYQQREAASTETMTAAPGSLTGEARDSAAKGMDSLDRKLREWKLTPEDIKGPGSLRRFELALVVSGLGEAGHPGATPTGDEGIAAPSLETQRLRHVFCV
ncbi:MAG: hypothetical protein PHE83_17060 [Opitutaceae bacterium]|nr:hypothetical protein [Opitutaceae bacterium]